MKRHSRLATAALAGLVAVGSLAATLAGTAPASAAEHRGGYDGPDRGQVVQRRDDHRYDRGGYDRRYVAPAYVPAYPAYGYVAPVYPAYGYAPSNGYVHVAAPGFSFGVGF